MDKVKIKRVKRAKKKISTKEKILGGLGVGSALLGGVGAVVAKPQAQPTRFVRQNETQAGEKTSKFKKALGEIFGGIKQAKAATRDGVDEPAPGPGIFNPIAQPTSLGPGGYMLNTASGGGGDRGSAGGGAQPVINVAPTPPNFNPTVAPSSGPDDLLNTAPQAAFDIVVNVYPGVNNDRRDMVIGNGNNLRASSYQVYFNERDVLNIAPDASHNLFITADRLPSASQLPGGIYSVRILDNDSQLMSNPYTITIGPTSTAAAIGPAQTGRDGTGQTGWGIGSVGGGTYAGDYGAGTYSSGAQGGGNASTISNILTGDDPNKLLQTANDNQFLAPKDSRNAPGTGQSSGSNDTHANTNYVGYNTGVGPDAALATPDDGDFVPTTDQLADNMGDANKEGGAGGGATGYVPPFLQGATPDVQGAWRIIQNYNLHPPDPNNKDEFAAAIHELADANAIYNAYYNSFPNVAQTGTAATSAAAHIVQQLQNFINNPSQSTIQINGQTVSREAAILILNGNYASMNNLLANSNIHPGTLAVAVNSSLAQAHQLHLNALREERENALNVNTGSNDTPAQVFTISPNVLPNAVVGQPYRNANGTTVTLSTTVPNAFFTLVGSLPDGLILNGNGTITGTVNATLVPPGNYTFGVRAQNTHGQNKTQPFTITVSPPGTPITGSTPPVDLTNTGGMPAWAAALQPYFNFLNSGYTLYESADDVKAAYTAYIYAQGGSATASLPLAPWSDLATRHLSERVTTAFSLYWLPPNGAVPNPLFAYPATPELMAAAREAGYHPSQETAVTAVSSAYFTSGATRVTSLSLPRGSTATLWIYGTGFMRGQASVKIYSGTTDVSNDFTISYVDVHAIGIGPQQQLGVTVTPKTSAAPGAYSLKVLPSASAAGIAITGITLTVPETASNPPVITTAAALPAATVGAAYTGPALTVTGLSGTVTWSLLTPPERMVINATTGAITWPTPVRPASGDVAVTVHVTNGTLSADKTFSLTVNPAVTAPAPRITGYDAYGRNFLVIAGQNFTATSKVQFFTPGTTTKVLEVTVPGVDNDGHPPTGNALGTRLLILSSMLANLDAGSYEVKVDNGSGQISNSFTIILGPLATVTPTITTATLPNATAGQTYSHTVIGTNTTGLTWAWAAASGSLPGGLTMSPSGTISGNSATPNTSQNPHYSVYLQLKDAAGTVVVQSQPINFTVDAAQAAAATVSGVMFSSSGAAVTLNGGLINVLATSLQNGNVRAMVTGTNLGNATVSVTLGGSSLTLPESSIVRTATSIELRLPGRPNWNWELGRDVSLVIRVGNLPALNYTIRPWTETL